MKISVIIAAYREAENLVPVLERVKASLPQALEILVVDDGSPDDTAKVAREAGARVVSHSRKMGKGLALRTGMREARGDLIVFLDADGQDPPEELPRLVAPILEDRADFTNGSKFLGECRPGAISSLNRGGNLFMSGLINLLFGARITDSQSGFRAFRRDKIADFDLIAREYEIETEMLIKSIKKRLRIMEIPVVREKRQAGKTGFNRVRNGCRILFWILKERFTL